MKTLKQYIQDDLFATPMNTVGMGNPMPPIDNVPGSGDLLQPLQPVCIDIKTGKKYKRRKKFRRYRII